MIFYDSKKNHKKTAFFCHKFMVNFYDKFMQKKKKHKIMQKTYHFFMIRKNIIKKLQFFAINFWVAIAHKFMIIFCHKFMQ